MSANAGPAADGDHVPAGEEDSGLAGGGERSDELLEESAEVGAGTDAARQRRGDERLDLEVVG